MLGRHAPLPRRGRRAMPRAWGDPDPNTRQKWHAVWPALRALPAADLALLDAGCGDGAWSLELAARRPGWRIDGVDRDETAIERARRAGADLGLGNVRFTTADLLEHEPGAPVDAVLSVLSAHYLAAAQRGDELFARLASWLRPGGELVALVPRRRAEVPFATRLPAPEWHAVFGAEQLRELCAAAGLHVQEISPRVGRLGAVAKQLTMAAAGRGAALRALALAAATALAAADRPGRPAAGDRSVYWLVRARR